MNISGEITLLWSEYTSNWVAPRISPQRLLRSDGNPQEGQELPDAAQVAAGVVPEGVEEGRPAVHRGPEGLVGGARHVRGGGVRRQRRVSGIETLHCPP